MPEWEYRKIDLNGPPPRKASQQGHLPTPLPGQWQMPPVNQAPILVVCDLAQLGGELVLRIGGQSNGDVVYAANEDEALQRLSQFKFTAAVLATTSSQDRLTAALVEKCVPCCILDTAASKPVNVANQETVVVYDIDLIVPTLQALIAQRNKKASNS